MFNTEAGIPLRVLRRSGTNRINFLGTSRFTSELFGLYRQIVDSSVRFQTPQTTPTSEFALTPKCANSICSFLGQAQEHLAPTAAQISGYLCTVMELTHLSSSILFFFFFFFFFFLPSGFYYF
jgi:hypothetical protein